MRLTIGTWVATSSTWSTISATSALRASGDWLAVMATTAAPRSRALSATSSSSVDAAAAADDHGHVAGLRARWPPAAAGAGRCRRAGHTEAQELELRVLGHHAVVAHGVELDPAAWASSSMARSIMSRLSWLRSSRMALAVLPSTLRPVPRRCRPPSPGVRHRHRGGQARGQAQLEVRQPLAAQGAAEADHRGLADLGRAAISAIGSPAPRAGAPAHGRPPAVRPATARAGAPDLVQDGRAPAGLLACSCESRIAEAPMKVACSAVIT
jgi:hypothetical protein